MQRSCLGFFLAIALLASSSACIAAPGGGSMEAVEHWLKVHETVPRFKDLADSVEKACSARGDKALSQPLLCWHAQEHALIEMSQAANADPEASSLVRGALSRDLQRVRQEQSQWRHFNLKARAAKRRVISGLMAAIDNANGDVKAGLEAVKAKPSAGQAERAAATRALTLMGGKCIWGCICGQAEGCPCCGYDAIFRSVLL